MECKHCNKKFPTALSLFNGKTVCPHCKNELLAINELTITKKNAELFALSRIALLRYLSPSSGDERTAVAVKEDRELLNMAFEYCDLAAKSGNPNAIFQMAYLLEYFQREDQNAVASIRLAFEYYYALCYSDAESVPAEKGTPEFTPDDFVELKILAGKNLLRICRMHEALLRNSMRYKYRTNETKLKAKYKGVSFAGDYKVAADEANRVNMAFDILRSTKSKNNPPMFGICMLSLDEASVLLNKQDADGKCYWDSYINKRGGGDLLHYMPCDQNGRTSGERYFYKIQSTARIEQILNDVKASGYTHIYLHFFNSQGKFKYSKGKQVERVQKELQANEQSRLLRLVDELLGNLSVFFDDDVEYFRWKNRHSAIEGIIDAICEEE